MMHLYWVALKSIWAKEIHRFMRIWVQTLVPPVITMTLYFIIFGNLIGSRIGDMHGFLQTLTCSEYGGHGGDDGVTCGAGDGHSLGAADPGYFLIGQLCQVHGFINIRHPDGEGNMKQSQQLFSPGRLGCKDQFHKILPFLSYSTPRRYRPLVQAPGSMGWGSR